MIDQKEGLKNYQRYLASVADTGGSGRPAKLKFKNIQFWGKNSSHGVFSHYPDQNILPCLSSNFLKLIKSAQKTKPSHASFPPAGKYWLVGLYLAGNSN